MSEHKIPCIIDCDPGADDAAAIFYALNHPNLDVLAITTVFGNVGLEYTTRNAHVILGMAKSTIQVASGHSKPLVVPRIEASSIHGNDGFGNMYESVKHLRSPLPIVENAVLHMKKLIKASKEPVVLFPIGPMTNIANLLLTYPELKPNIKCISFMGGGLEFGNRTPSAEYNFLCDPEAAQIVLQSEVPLIMVGLDITEQAFIKEKELARIKAVNNPISNLLLGVLAAYTSKDANLHDPVAIMAISDPDIFEFKVMEVVVETSGVYSAGRTIGDVRKNAKHENDNCKVAMKLDHAEFMNRFIASLEQYGLEAENE
jgi:inosine-uridine nucleoside N-ribohydrolase